MVAPAAVASGALRVAFGEGRLFERLFASVAEWLEMISLRENRLKAEAAIIQNLLGRHDF